MVDMPKNQTKPKFSDGNSKKKTQKTNKQTNKLFGQYRPLGVV